MLQPTHQESASVAASCCPQTEVWHNKTERPMWDNCRGNVHLMYWQLYLAHHESSTIMLLSHQAVQWWGSGMIQRIRESCHQRDRTDCSPNGSFTNQTVKCAELILTHQHIKQLDTWREHSSINSVCLCAVPSVKDINTPSLVEPPIFICQEPRLGLCTCLSMQCTQWFCGNQRSHGTPL